MKPGLKIKIKDSLDIGKTIYDMAYRSQTGNFDHLIECALKKNGIATVLHSRSYEDQDKIRLEFLNESHDGYWYYKSDVLKYFDLGNEKICHILYGEK